MQTKTLIMLILLLVIPILFGGLGYMFIGGTTYGGLSFFVGLWVALFINSFINMYMK